LESPLIYNELHERIAFAIRSIIHWNARIGTFVAVVIETPEHKAILESSEVMTKHTANSCIAFCSSKNAVRNSSAYHQILPVAAMRVSNPDRSPFKIES
jgi:hypothetical protein